MSDRNKILDENKSVREKHAATPQPTKFDWGFLEFRIPMKDYAMLKIAFPGLFHPDADTARKAWQEFRFHPASEAYRVVRSPQKVRRSNKHNIIIK